ncbi:MAG TPA: hypothetical protein VF060_26115 [Trebonia sp.]
MLPAEVRELLAGEPGDDTWEPVAHLLTTGDDGFPRVCLLSRAELATSADAVGCVLRARHTIANLRRDGLAVLAVTGEQAAYYVRLRARTILDTDDGSGRAAIAFDVDDTQADTLGIPLRPMMFRASSRVRHLEQAGANREFLERLGFG